MKLKSIQLYLILVCKFSINSLLPPSPQTREGRKMLTLESMISPHKRGTDEQLAALGSSLGFGFWWLGILFGFVLLLWWWLLSFLFYCYWFFFPPTSTGWFTGKTLKQSLEDTAITALQYSPTYYSLSCGSDAEKWNTKYFQNGDVFLPLGISMFFYRIRNYHETRPFVSFTKYCHCTS